MPYTQHFTGRQAYWLKHNPIVMILFFFIAHQQEIAGDGISITLLAMRNDDASVSFIDGEDNKDDQQQERTRVQTQASAW